MRWINGINKSTAMACVPSQHTVRGKKHRSSRMLLIFAGIIYSRLCIAWKCSNMGKTHAYKVRRKGREIERERKKNILKRCSSSVGSSKCTIFYGSLCVCVHRAHVLFIHAQYQYHPFAHRQTQTQTPKPIFQVQCCSAQWKSEHVIMCPCRFCSVLHLYRARVLFLAFLLGCTWIHMRKHLQLENCEERQRQIQRHRANMKSGSPYFCCTYYQRV